MTAPFHARRAFSSSVYLRRRKLVLLVRHKRLQMWLPLGGELKMGRLLPTLQKQETPLEAAIREVREESGITDAFFPISAIHGVPDGFVCYEEHLAGSKGLHMNFAFVADTTHETITLCDEHEEYRWFSLREAIQDTGIPRNVWEITRMVLE